MLKALSTQLAAHWPTAMLLGLVITLLGGRTWLQRTRGAVRTGQIIGYKSFDDDDGATSWAAIVEWHDAEGRSRTFVEACGRAEQPWPVGTQVMLALPGRDKPIVVTGPA